MKKRKKDIDIDSFCEGFELGASFVLIKLFKKRCK